MNKVAPIRTMSSPTDPFTKMIRHMCTKDKVVQSLYEHTISWADVPSDDEVLELDDWKSYQKMIVRAKDSYKNHVAAHKKVYTIPQRVKTKKQCNQVVVATRTPYITLKHRLESNQKEIVEEIVHQPPTDYEAVMDPIVPPSDLAPFILSNVTASYEMAPTKMIEVTEPIKHKTISFSPYLYHYIFLSVIIILVYNATMYK